MLELFFDTPHRLLCCSGIKTAFQHTCTNGVTDTSNTAVITHTTRPLLRHPRARCHRRHHHHWHIITTGTSSPLAHVTLLLTTTDLSNGIPHVTFSVEAVPTNLDLGDNPKPALSPKHCTALLKFVVHV
jgi:hypothetical protein